MTNRQSAGEWLVGGGETGDLIRSMDWADSPLGSRDTWPSTLRAVVQLVVDSQFPMALLCGRELVMLYNDAYRIICADRHPRALGRPNRDIWPEVWHINEPIFRAVLERAESIYLEDKLFPIERNGRREDAYFTLCYSPVRGEDGEVAGSLVTLLETTARIREHDALVVALKEEEERLRLAIDATDIGAFELVYQNPASARIHGYASSEGGRLDSAVLTSTWKGWDEAGRPLLPGEWPMSRVLRQERFSNQILRAQRVETGREFYASYNGCPVYDAKGQMTFGFITIRDISEEVRGQRALRASEEKFSKAFRGSAAAVTITRLEDGMFIDLNPTYTRITGYAREDLVGVRPPGIWKTPRDRADFVNALRRDGAVENVEVHLIKKNGEEWTGLVSAQVIDIAGEEAVISSVVDITRRQQAEAELKEREGELRRALARLAEEDRRKDEFIAILSHELRNPLAPIRYALPVLERTPLPESATRAVEVIDRQLDHLTRLVDDLLDVSRITRGKIQLKREHVALGAIVDAAVEATSPVVRAARHTLEIVVAEEPIWLYADAARVSQIITNLLNNSAKYTPRGGRIRLEAGRDNGHAYIRVQDNGMGIPPEDLPHVFEMFRQVDRADKS